MIECLFCCITYVLQMSISKRKQVSECILKTQNRSYWNKEVIFCLCLTICRNM